MSIVQEINCSHCGAPIPFEPGEILATCKYCGYTVVVKTGKDFTFAHSMLPNNYSPEEIEAPIRNWMRSGFLKPSDLAKSKIVEKVLIYLPFWVVSMELESIYEGLFERITPAIVKKGSIKKKYDWLVVARRASEFPTREYDVPLKGKIPYDFRRIEAFAKLLNSEIDKQDAIDIAKQEVEAHHQFLVQEDVDRIITIKNDSEIDQTVYIHCPIWFIKYEYKSKLYNLFVDGSSGTVIKGDIPPTDFGLFS
ncbi:MAG: hypothetical protein PVF96_08660 [Candidatus Bathyarchaeota archaeon]|jgi:hypothetical protein